MRCVLLLLLLLQGLSYLEELWDAEEGAVMDVRSSKQIVLQELA